MPCASATFTVWSSAWLAGAAAPDDVLDALGPWAQAHDVVAVDADTARTHSLVLPGAPPGSVTFLLAALRRAAPRGPGRVVLPAPGRPARAARSRPVQPRGDGRGRGRAVRRRGLGIVPAAIGRRRAALDGVPGRRPGRPARSTSRLPQAERDLRDQVRQSASVLTSLGVARHRPGVREEIAAKLRARPRVAVARRHARPARCGCCSTPTRSRRSWPRRRWTSPAARCRPSAAAARREALRPLETAVRVARRAAVTEAVRVLAASPLV